MSAAAARNCIIIRYRCRSLDLQQVWHWSGDRRESASRPRVLITFCGRFHHVVELLLDIGAERPHPFGADVDCEARSNGWVSAVPSEPHLQLATSGETTRVALLDPIEPFASGGVKFDGCPLRAGLQTG